MPSKSTHAFRTISEAGQELGLQPHVLRFWESKFSQIQPMKRNAGRRFYRPEDIELLRGIKILLHDEKHPIKDVKKLIRVRGVQAVIRLGQLQDQKIEPKDVKDTDLVPRRIKRASKRKTAPNSEPTQANIPDRIVPVAVATTALPVAEESTALPVAKATTALPVAKATTALPVAEATTALDENTPTVETARHAKAQGDDIVRPIGSTTAPIAPTPSTPRNHSQAISKTAPTSSDMDAAERAELEGALERLKNLKSQWEEFK